MVGRASFLQACGKEIDSPGIKWVVVHGLQREERRGPIPGAN